VSIDFALPKCKKVWSEILPEESARGHTNSVRKSKRVILGLPPSLFKGLK